MGLPLIHDDNGIRWITLDRPEIRNALRVEDLDHVADAVRSAGPNVRAIILTGAGDRAFSAGMHVKTFADATPESARTALPGCVIVWAPSGFVRDRRWLWSTVTASGRASRWLWPVTFGSPIHRCNSAFPK